MYVYIYIHGLHRYTSICVYIDLYLWIYTCTYTCVDTYTYRYTYLCLHTQIHTHTYVYIHVHTYVHTQILHPNATLKYSRVSGRILYRFYLRLYGWACLFVLTSFLTANILSHTENVKQQDRPTIWSTCFIDVCMYSCMYVFMYVCMYVCKWMCHTHVDS